MKYVSPVEREAIFSLDGKPFFGMPFFIEFEREAIFSTFCEHLRVEAIFSVFEPHWRESIEQWLQSGYRRNSRSRVVRGT